MASPMRHAWIGRYVVVWLWGRDGFESIWPVGVVGPYTTRADFYRTFEVMPSAK